MEGRHVIVSLNQMSPYVIIQFRNGKIKVQGYLGEIWIILEQQLKFSSEYIIEEYDAAVYHIHQKNRHVLLRPIVMNSDDVEHFDFTMPLISSWYELYIKDSDEVNSSNSYIRNWSTELWLCTALMIFIFGFFLHIMLRISNSYFGENRTEEDNQHEIRFTRYYSKVNRRFRRVKQWRLKAMNRLRRKDVDDYSLGDCFVSAVATFCSQGCHIQSHITSIRMLILSFLIFGMIMLNAYSALLVSQLTLGERFLPFTNLEEIPDKAKSYSLCVREESYAHFFFKINETSTDLKSNWANIVNKKPCTKGPFSPEVMCASHVAILESPAVMHENLQTNFKCKMTHLKGKYSKVDLSILIGQGFDDRGKSALNKKILHLREVGILKHLIEKWITKEHVSPAEDPDLQVTYDHIEGVLTVYASAIGFCFALLVLENIIHFAGRYRSKRLHIHRNLKFPVNKSARSFFMCYDTTK